MAPVGSYESLHAAIAAGADSVYFGVEQLNMRAASSVNFTLDDLHEIVSVAHAAGVKTYLTVNIVIYDDELATMQSIIDCARREGVDAIIAADMAAVLYARRVGGAYIHPEQRIEHRGGEVLLAVGRRHGAGARADARTDIAHLARDR